MTKKNETKPYLDFAEPLLLENHKKPITRRDFIGRGLIAGSAVAIGPALLGVLGSNAYAAVTETDCGIVAGAGGNGKVPFMAYDLTGGANIAGSNVLVGGAAGQLDFLSNSGYSILGLPANKVPSLAGQTSTLDSGGMGLQWHADSALLKGIRDIASQATLDNVNGAIICARSANDTSNNPHNPMYGIYKAGLDGDVVSLIGTKNTDSGGNSAAPASMIDLSVRPTKIASGADALGLVDTGKLAQLFPDPNNAKSVLQTIQSISDKKLSKIQMDAALDKLIQCGYLESTVAASGDASRTDINADPLLSSVFTNSGFKMSDYPKTAAVAKLVVNGVAGAGTVQLGGYDYHNSTRTTGDTRDRRAGQEIGAALEYARMVGKPLMIYVFSDGSVASNGNTDSTGKGIWKGDNSTTAASLMLVYSPNGLPQIANNNQQIGYYRSSGAIETAASVVSNNVDQLAEAIVLNYMALHNDQGRFSTVLPKQGLGTTAADFDKLIAFAPIV